MVISMQHNMKVKYMTCFFLDARGSNSSLGKRVIAWDPNLVHRHLWDYLRGHECKQTWQKTKCNVSAGLKQLKTAEWKVELKEKNMKM